jgi:hypothetical protein
MVFHDDIEPVTSTGKTGATYTKFLLRETLRDAQAGGFEVLAMWNLWYLVRVAARVATRSPLYAVTQKVAEHVRSDAQQ